MIHELDGHAIDSQAMGRYGKRYTPDILLREAVGKIDYGVDLSFLMVDKGLFEGHIDFVYNDES